MHSPAGSTAQARGAERLVYVDPEAYGRHFARAPFRVSHGLRDHPLFEIERLVQLSRELPPRLVEYHPGDLPISHDPTVTPRTGLGIEETIRRIETCGSWMVLKHAERSPEYGALLDRCVDEVAASAGRSPGDFFHRAAFLFVSSPRSITPLHLDPENNFLLQVRGEKTIFIGGIDDREVIDEPGLERFFSGGHRNVLMESGFEARSSRIELDPGEGVFVPMPAPHYVSNGEDVSISFSVTFHTPESDALQGAYWTNQKLRRLGLRPRTPGSSDSVDRWKYRLYRGLRGVKRRLRPRA